MSNKAKPDVVVWNAVQTMDRPFTSYTVMSRLSDSHLNRNISSMQVSKQLNFLARKGKLEIIDDKVARTYIKKEERTD